MKGLVTVRQAQIADGVNLYSAWQTLREYNSSLDTRIRLATVSERDFVASLEQTTKRASSSAFVAERDDHLIGFGTCALETNAPDRLPERHATIGYLYVDPTARRSGVGRLLFQAILLWAKTQDGVSHVEMPVLESDGAAVAFWSSLGFQPFIRRLWAPLDGGAGA